MWAKHKEPGFTIVELLIVIVVIGVLAAITIVAFNGIQNRARASSVSSALSQASKKIAVWQVDSGTISPTCAEFNTLLNSSGSSCSFTLNTVAYQYTAGTSGAYCITATDSTVSYKITESSQPTTGGCAGHGVGGQSAITNLMLNPSAETSTTSYGIVNGSTVALSSSQAKNGSNSVIVTMPAATSTNVGVNVSPGYLIGNNFQSNTTYTFSAWVYVPSTTVDLRMSAQGTGTSSSTCNSQTTSVKNAWVRISCQLITAASGQTALYILNHVASSAGMQFYIDSVMFSEGATLYNYADGASSSWIWNGAPNNSSSTGPAL